MAPVRSTDALIIGGGPAGSMAAAWLAQAGIGIVLLEGPARARPNIGESLLPHFLPFLDRLGVLERVESLPHTRRAEGLTFTSSDGCTQASYYFDSALPPALPHAFQIRRDELDATLLAAARAAGAEVLAGWSATAPIWEGAHLAGVSARSPEGKLLTIEARTVLDASGRSSFLAGQMGWRFPYPMHRKVSAVATFEGVWLPPGRAAGNTTLVYAGDGWYWLIPFADGTVSVGVVRDARRGTPASGMLEIEPQASLDLPPEVARRLAGARRVSEPATFADYSYRVMKVAGDGYCLIGDAAGFLDPIFSAGLLVAAATAASAADDVIEALGHKPRIESSDFGPTVALTRSLQRLLTSLTRALYNPHFLALLFARPDQLQLSAALGSLLAGDLLGPQRWKCTARYRLLLWLAQAQEWATRWGHPLVAPLPHSGAGAGN
ncbi:MAG: NAD(P)/FAD-dependent oxidoreductase [Acidobacteriota bacterium]